MSSPPHAHVLPMCADTPSQAKHHSRLAAAHVAPCKAVDACRQSGTWWLTECTYDIPQSPHRVINSEPGPF